MSRLEASLAQDTRPTKMAMTDPMTIEDLIAIYYVRKIQCSVAIHVCQVGYCRKSKTEPCKYRLPAEEITLSDKPCGESVQMSHRKVYLVVLHMIWLDSP